VPPASHKSTRPKLSGFAPGHPAQQGYILLTLLLFVCLMIIAIAVIVPSVAFEIRRAREEELVHRGVQYTRAIRLFSKHTGRYPNRLEELIGGSDFRYIRKLYKDPITGRDFRLLHLGDVQPNTPNVNPPDSQIDQIIKDVTSQNSPQSADPSASAPDPATSPGQNNSQADAAAAAPSPQPTGPQPGQLIFGVASTSKKLSIRSFDHKEHYNEWWFFYDPRFDRGYEIKGPTSMTMPTFPAPGQPGPSTGIGQQPQTFQQPQQAPAEPPQTAPQ
jgi:type II secretory pathway pseudopilin PulG